MGRKLVEAVSAATKERDAKFVLWIVREGNDGATAFYRRLDLFARAPVTAHAILVK